MVPKQTNKPKKIKKNIVIQPPIAWVDKPVLDNKNHTSLLIFFYQDFPDHPKKKKNATG